MIYSLTGKILKKTLDTVVISCAGVGLSLIHISGQLARAGGCAHQGESRQVDADALGAGALAGIDNIVQNSLDPRCGLPNETWDAENGWSCRGWWFDGMYTGGSCV